MAIVPNSGTVIEIRNYKCIIHFIKDMFRHKRFSTNAYSIANAFILFPLIDCYLTIYFTGWYTEFDKHVYRSIDCTEYKIILNLEGTNTKFKESVKLANYTDEDPGSRIESFAIIRIHGVSTKYKLYFSICKRTENLLAIAALFTRTPPF